jgi:hypothetical protein
LIWRASSQIAHLVVDVGKSRPSGEARRLLNRNSRTSVWFLVSGFLVLVVSLVPIHATFAERKATLRQRLRLIRFVDVVLNRRTD